MFPIISEYLLFKVLFFGKSEFALSLKTWLKFREIFSSPVLSLNEYSNPVVIDFHATWCGPCKVLSPILEELDDEIEGVEFVKLDVDQHPQIAGQNQVMGVPTVVILKDGEVKDRFVGVQPKEVIKEKITSLG